MAGREAEGTSKGRSVETAISHEEIDRLAGLINRDEGLFRSLVELNRDVLFIHYNQWIVYANQGAADAVGFESGSELIGRSMLEFAPSEEKARTGKRIDPAARTEGRTPLHEHVLINRWGDEVNLESSSEPVIFEGKRLIAASGRLINAHKQAGENIRLSEQRAQLILAASHIGLWEWRPRDGQVYCSDRCFTMLGYEPGEFEPTFKIWQDRIHPEDRTRVDKELETGLASGDDFEMEFRMFAKDGDRRWIRCPCVVAERDENGAPLRVVGTQTDVTEERRLQDALKTSEERFRMLFNSLTEGVAMHEVVQQNDEIIDYRIMDVNPAFFRHTGLERDQVIGQLASQVYGSGQAPYLDIYAKVAQAGKPHHFTTYFSPLGRHFWVSVTSPRTGEFATVFNDITEQVESQVELERLIAELESKNEDMELFLYTVSHDLKSPLITIKGFLSMIKQDISVGRTDRLDSDMGRINSAADKMQQLLDELLSLSRIGRLDNPHRWLSSVNLAREAVELIAGPINLNKAEVIIDETMPRMYGDGARLRELFQNLLDNAVKFAGPDPAPRIFVGHRREKDEIVYYVQDNGPGIDEKYRERIFGLFNKLNTKIEGTGLGLALAKRIVETHGGRIWVEEGPEKDGAVFCFTLPRPEKNGDDQDES